jgi:hypothetical protein
VFGIPVHSVLLMPTREEAINYPRRDLELAFCPSCGFIQNVRFDPEVHRYSTQYEPTQAFSPTFSGWATKLVKLMVEQYGCHHQTVVEIGCGKGEFLYELCKVGQNRGIGIDPAVIPELIGDLDGQIEWIADFYEAHTARTQGADTVVSRHTLEHIENVGAFTELTRRNMREGALFFMEIPDMRRILEEFAFWDIYYEHASYFTQGSMGRLYRQMGFKPLANYRDYGEQYLMLFATASTPAEAEAVPMLAGEDDLSEIRQLVLGFRNQIAARLAGWRRQIEGYQDEGKRMAIWGGGSKGVSFLTTLGIGDEIPYAVDINPRKQGHFMPGSGHQVVSPRFMRDYRPDVIFVMNPVYTPEIRRTLADLGLEPKLIPVGV